MTPLIEARGISKAYGALKANDHVDLRLNPGEVHALIGENGAGKSTLSKILYGFVQPDAGDILVGGKPAVLRTPRDARALGVGMVFQNFMLIPPMSVLENIALFLPDLPAVVDRRAVEQRVHDFAKRFGLGVDVHAPVRQLSVGDRQKVEILKLLLARARVLILDEPTKVLAPHEVAELFRVFESLKAEGYAILFITHKIREVLACADRISVMRHGAMAGSFARGEADAQKLVETMFGEHAPMQAAVASAAVAPSTPASPVLELRGASCRATGSETALAELDISVGAGEIVGIAGVSGSGQKELGDLILGLRPLASGSKWLCGEDASAWSIARMREAGVAVIPEDPLAMAAFPGMSVRENLALGTGRRYWRGATVDWPALEAAMAKSFRALSFPMPALDLPLGALSGGNVQRVVVAREMAHQPRLVLALYPTRGLDVRSAASLRELLRSVRGEGRAVLLVSEDLDELAELSDRLLVLFAGAVAGEFRRGAWTAEEVGLLMTGSKEAAHA
ncbi:ABC transporter ATP-binding protein [Caenimonas aquaedulcis]|uniref:ABC transporter ATP-binding protein n=1 Tax=Caenimonas aquaedulcis TaxID=2793270 RepID=A0A931MJ90_9BURK|nr:ABC transporter ATP-binding protein [Caenimonas aquaedulcis]